MREPVLKEVQDMVGEEGCVRTRSKWNNLKGVQAFSQALASGLKENPGDMRQGECRIGVPQKACGFQKKTILRTSASSGGSAPILQVNRPRVLQGRGSSDERQHMEGRGCRGTGRVMAMPWTLGWNRGQGKSRPGYQSNPPL